MKTKYLTIKDYLSGLIQKGGDGAPLPSESELCSFMDASRITVRKALSALEKEGSLFKHKGKGAFISKKPLVKNKHLNIFLGISKDFRFSSSSEIMAGILDYMKESGNGLHMFVTNKNMQETLADIQKHEIDGIIGFAPYLADYPIYEELRQKGHPVLLVNRMAKNSHYSYVSVDFSQASFLATDTLLRKRHKKIMLVGTSDWMPYSEYLEEGFISALKKNGISKADYEIVNADGFKSEESFLKEMGRDFEAKFNKLSPTAIVCVGELFFTRAVYPILEKKGICIPESVEVALCSKTLEKTPMRHLLHEIRQPEYELGKKSMEELEKMIRGETNKVNILLEPELIEKEFSK